jgi:hypothetical protein
LADVDHNTFRNTFSRTKSVIFLTQACLIRLHDFARMLIWHNVNPHLENNLSSREGSNMSRVLQRRVQSASVARFSLVALVSLASSLGCQPNNPVAVTIAPDSAKPTLELSLERKVPFFPQETSGTCWIACARMVYAYYGQQMTESELLKHVNELNGDSSRLQFEATERECLIALAQEQGLYEQLKSRMQTQLGKTQINLQPTIQGLFATVLQANRSHDFTELVSGLKNQQPVVIVCRIGPWTDSNHAMVVTHARFAGAANDQRLVSIDVLDPAQKPDGLRTLPAEYIQRNLLGVYSREVARQILEAEVQAVKVS